MKLFLKHKTIPLFLSFLLFFACVKDDEITQIPEAPQVAQTSTISIKLKNSDTLSKSLEQTGLSNNDIYEIITNLKKVFSPKLCRAGDNYEIILDSSNQWTNFYYYIPGITFYTVEKSPDGITASKKTKTSEKIIATASGSINTSLWESMSALKIHPEVILNFADIFAWQFDFLTETRKGDTFKIIWEKNVTKDGTEINGPILAAQFTDMTAVRFTNSKGKTDYYSPEGKSLRSAFLKAPLQFRRISSYFTLRRYHPILKYFRPHLGIDYAAPKGTPVSAICEGTVTFAGRKGGLGKYIALKHPNGYASFYGHLSRFGQGIRRGVHVKQGQLIGYVGSTGLSTGPHLDFRVKLNNKFINFLKIKVPPSISISGHENEAFQKAKNETFDKLAQIK